MGYKILQLELTKPFEPIRLAEGETGVGLVARWNGRLIGFKMLRLSNGAELSAQAQETIADGSFAMQVLTAKIEAERPAPQATALPSLTIAICTKDRAVRLSLR
jgi:hypothetical protein